MSQQNSFFHDFIFYLETGSFSFLFLNKAIKMYISGIMGVRNSEKIKFAQNPRYVFRPNKPTTKQSIK